MRRCSLLLAAALCAHGDVVLTETEHYTHEEARLYCRELGGGWRMMDIRELFESSAPFRGGFSYWSSTTLSSGDAVTGTGSEGDGAVIAVVGAAFYPKERNVTLSPLTKKIGAACTNDPEKKSQRDFVQTPQGTLDPGSSLLWHPLDATDKKAKYTHEKAKEMCESLSLYGRSWRLPSVEELYGIVDYGQIRPSVDMKYFGPMMHRYYWSSDELNANEAYAVGFKLGSVATVSKKEEAYARCVSDR